MKRILAIATVLLALHGSIIAQQINKSEYYFDKDPGPGKGTALSLSARDSTTDTLNFSSSGLGIGFHRIYLRYKYTNGLWGIAEDRLFYIYDTATPVIKTSVAAGDGEYFIDHDPGTGKGYALPSATPGDTVDQNLTISTTGLPVGFHRVYVRRKDVDNHWGIADDRLFYIYDTAAPVLKASPPLTTWEYFIDTTKAPGKGVMFRTSAPADSVSDTFSIHTTGLASGKHTLYVHVRDSAGQWSAFASRPFLICSSLLATPAVTGKNHYCAGDTITLSASKVSGAVKYLWQGPKGFTDTALTVKIPKSDSTWAGVYSLVAIRSGGTACDTSNVAYDTVIVNPKLVPNAGSNLAVCKGSSATIGSKAISGQKYAWTSSPSGFSSTSASPGVSPKVTTTYYLTVSNSGGCSSSASVTVTVNPLPAPSAGSAQTVCKGSSVSIGSSAVSGHSYSWTSNPPGFTSVSAQPSVSPLANTLYKLRETINSTGCSASDSVQVGVNPLPDALWTVNNTTGNTYYFHVQDSSLTPSSYVWGFGDGTGTGTGYGTTHTYTQKQVYTVTLTATNTTGCSQKHDSTLDVSGSGILPGNLADNLRLSVYPNPFSSQTTVHFSLPEAARVKISITDTKGNILYVAADQKFSTRDNSIEISARETGLTTGTYVVRIYINEQTICRKIMILR